uniref:Uncharacterized protein n=1 Tax=Heterorhabditis bacteriophora TaxID=37862 RepID=A0A1I7WQ69_HETBA
MPSPHRLSQLSLTSSHLFRKEPQQTALFREMPIISKLLSRWGMETIVLILPYRC